MESPALETDSTTEILAKIMKKMTIRTPNIIGPSTPFQNLPATQG